jgi:phosphatidylglycerol:prolipoprotein diacylglycerol transferase
VHPVLFHIGPLALRSYGVMLALAFMIGITLAHARAPRHGVEPQRLLDVYLIIVFGALVGSRLLFIAEHAAFYAAEPSRLLQLRQGGLSMYGGVVMAAAGAALYCKRTASRF